ncbi:hypothetical protein ACLB2K_071069 [Fragaria x ananassa]
MSEEKMKVPLFDGHYYDHWSELMENLLRSKGLWGLVENGFEEPTAGALLTEAHREQLEDARAKDYKVKSQHMVRTLQLCLQYGAAEATTDQEHREAYHPRIVISFCENIYFSGTFSFMNVNDMHDGQLESPRHRHQKPQFLLGELVLHSCARITSPPSSKQVPYFQK